MNLEGFTVLFILCFSRVTSSDECLKNEASCEASLLKRKIASISPAEIEQLINMQYFDAAANLISRSHKEGVDISVPIRNAVSNMRSRLDHVIKLLDPEYSRPQKVPPAFQWTQNDTSIFILLKYSRRFNAPGAVDVSDLNCSFTDRALFFSAIGGHSGKRFEYALNLDFFDKIDPNQSRWSEGSVGKVTLTIAKANISRWPRLLAKPIKIDNMHYWLEYGEKLEGSLKGLPEISNSGLSCQDQAKVYCPMNDSCKDSCDDCKGKSSLVQDSNICAGPPVYSPRGVQFTDVDTDRGFIAGFVSVHLRKEYHRFDIDGFNLYLQPTGEELQEHTKPLTNWSGSVVNGTKIEIPRFEVGEDGYEIRIVPFNAYGENRKKLTRAQIRDLYLPKGVSSIDPIDFLDMDGGSSSLKGKFVFSSPENTDGATQLSFHWGKDNSTKSSKSRPAFAETPISKGSLTINSTYVPYGSSHVLVFAKSEAGESEQPVGTWAIVDRQRPQGVVEGVRINGDRYVEFNKATEEKDLTGYAVKLEWTGKDNKKQNKEIEIIPVSSFWSFGSTLKTTQPVAYPEPEWKDPKVCVYQTNGLGNSSRGGCVSLGGDNHGSEL